LCIRNIEREGRETVSINETKKGKMSEMKRIEGYNTWPAQFYLLKDG
jgi:hypothetical protein